MADVQRYVPILKGKEGEFSALETLNADVRRLVLPLIEVPPVPYDYANDRPAKSLEDHVSGIAQRLMRCWKDDPIYVELPWLGEEQYLSDGTLAVTAVLGDCRAAQLQAIPVITRESTSDLRSAAGRHASTCKSGVCIRLTVDDFGEEVDIDSEITAILEAVSLKPRHIDILLDLKEIGTEGKELLVTRYMLNTLPDVDQWRRVTIAGASFPEDLSDVRADATEKLPRSEWDLWRAIKSKPQKLPRKDLLFGDYAISHPIPKELDPRIMRMSASIRYSTQTSWLVLKGRNVREYGFEQYFELSSLLVQRPEFAGADFSWGDAYIQKCARHESGPGNATTWRKVGTNHHLTLVARQLEGEGVS